MKHLFVCYAFFTMAVSLSAQTYFAPIGTQWTYGRYQFGPEPPDPEFALITAVDTLTFQGKKVLKLVGGADCGTLPEQTYLYQEGEKTYAWTSNTEEFRLLYDFGLQTGDTLTAWSMAAFGPNAYVQVVIDLVLTFEYAGALRKTQIVHEVGASNYFWGSRNYAGIGSNSFMFPQYGGCDPVLGILACFSSNPDDPCVVGVDDAPAASRTVQIAPSPAISTVQITMPFEQGELIVRNTTGTIVYQGNMPQQVQTLDCSAWKPGLYLVTCTSDGGQVAIGKVVKPN